MNSEINVYMDALARRLRFRADEAHDEYTSEEFRRFADQIEARQYLVEKAAAYASLKHDPRCAQRVLFFQEDLEDGICEANSYDTIDTFLDEILTVVRRQHPREKVEFMDDDAEHDVAGVRSSGIDPSLRAIVAGAAKSTQAPTGIITFEPVEFDHRSFLIFDVADVINCALTGPAIHVADLAEMIVDRVLGDG